MTNHSRTAVDRPPAAVANDDPRRLGRLRRRRRDVLLRPVVVVIALVLTSALDARNESPDMSGAEALLAGVITAPERVMETIFETMGLRRAATTRSRSRRAAGGRGVPQQTACGVNMDAGAEEEEQEQVTEAESERAAAARRRIRRRALASDSIFDKRNKERDPNREEGGMTNPQPEEEGGGGASHSGPPPLEPSPPAEDPSDHSNEQPYPTPPRSSSASETKSSHRDLYEFVAFVCWYVLLVLCCIVPTACAYRRRILAERRAREEALAELTGLGNGNNSAGGDNALDAELERLRALSNLRSLGGGGLGVGHGDNMGVEVAPGPNGESILLLRSTGSDGRPIAFLASAPGGIGTSGANGSVHLSREALAESLIGIMDPAQRERFLEYRQERLGMRRRECLMEMLACTTMTVKETDLIERTPISPLVEGGGSNADASEGLAPPAANTHASSGEGEEEGRFKDEEEELGEGRTTGKNGAVEDEGKGSRRPSAGAREGAAGEAAAETTSSSLPSTPQQFGAYYDVSDVAYRRGGGADGGSDNGDMDHLVLRLPVGGKKGTADEENGDGCRDDNGQDEEDGVGAASSSSAPRIRSHHHRTVPNACAICLSPYEPGSSVTWSPSHKTGMLCPHAFHTECVLTWLARTTTTTTTGGGNDANEPLCPCCRQDFVDRDDLGRRLQAAAAATAAGPPSGAPPAL